MILVYADYSIMNLQSQSLVSCFLHLETSDSSVVVALNLSLQPAAAWRRRGWARSAADVITTLFATKPVIWVGSVSPLFAAFDRAADMLTPWRGCKEDEEEKEKVKKTHSLRLELGSWLRLCRFVPGQREVYWWNSDQTEHFLNSNQGNMTFEMHFKCYKVVAIQWFITT